MKTIKCKSGITGWQCRLQKNYKNFEEFKDFNRVYNIVNRLGFSSAYGAWNANPIIQGSTEPSDLRTVGFRTLSKIVDPVDGRRGAPMGRSNIYPEKYSIVDVGAKHKYLVDPDTKESKIIYDSAVPMSDSSYDKGGAYWGIAAQLRVQYTKDLTYIRFYRLGDEE